MPSSHFILCRPLPLLPPIPPSIRVFSNESPLCMRWPKYWSFSFSIILSKEIPGLISFRMDWLDLLAVQGTLKSLLQHHSPGSHQNKELEAECISLHFYHRYLMAIDFVFLNRNGKCHKINHCKHLGSETVLLYNSDKTCCFVVCKSFCTCNFFLIIAVTFLIIIYY